MKSINIKREVAGDFEEVIAKVTAALSSVGFGVLTRIDLHAKFKEKLGKDVEPVAILGACNPQLAYEAYRVNTDVASLLPCNAVVRQVSKGMCSVELARPTMMMEILGNQDLVGLAQSADQKLEESLDHLRA